MITQVIDGKQITQALKNLGVKPGMTLEVHSSLKNLGYIVGYAQTVVDALLDCVGYEGTIVMPLQCSDNSEPGSWIKPPAPREMWDQIRDNIPAFDPIESDLPGMGEVVNNFRRRQGVYYTRHPSCAFVAYGKYAKLICSHQNLNYSLNEHSPLGRMIDLQAKVLLLGVDYDNCTGMHLAEYESHVRPIMIYGSAIDRGQGREWVKYLDIELNSDEFKEPGKRLEKANLVSIGRINQTTLKLFDLKQAVNYTKTYLSDKYQ